MPFRPRVAIHSQEPLAGCDPGCAERGRREGAKTGADGVQTKIQKKIMIKRQRRENEEGRGYGFQGVANEQNKKERMREHRKKGKSLNGQMTFGGNWISVNRSCDQLVSSLDG